MFRNFVTLLYAHPNLLGKDIDYQCYPISGGSPPGLVPPKSHFVLLSDYDSLEYNIHHFKQAPSAVNKDHSLPAMKLLFKLIARDLT